ncbi:MAG: hypothetical protein ACK4N5_20180, partial [Myxococcales bacterium]
LRTAGEIALGGGTLKRPSGLPQPKPVPQTNSTGFYGLNRFRGLISEEYLPALRGAAKVAVYQKMESDGLVQAMLTALELPVKAAAWVVEPAGRDANAQRARDLVEDQLFGRLGQCWETEVEKLLSYLHYGFHVSAKQWAVVRGEAVLTELRDLHPRTILQGGKNWEFDAEGHVIGVWQYGAAGDTFREEFVPGRALLHLANRMRFGDPEGRSVLRAGYKHWLIKDELYRLDAIGKERGAVGTPIGIYPATATESDQNKLKDLCRNVHVHENGYGVFPQGTELRNFAVDTRTDDLLASIQHHDTMLALSILAQFLMLGQEGNSGAYALSADQSDLFMLCLASVADYVAARINREVIPEIVAPVPSVRTGEERRFVMPSRCPACGGPISRPAGEAVARCTNLQCPAQAVARVVHFASRDAMDIEHLGERTATALLDLGLVSDVGDLFRLGPADLAKVPGFKDRSIENLLAAFARAKDRPIDRLL